MPVTSLPDWIAHYAQPENIWFAKRLSANDTQQTRGHQAGPYIPKTLLFSVLPGLNKNAEENPRVALDAFVDSHADVRTVSAIWYNGQLFGKTRNETRVTGWGGLGSAMLDPKSTGALAVFVFEGGASGETKALHVWVTDENGYEDEVLEDVLGPIDPGTHLIWRPGDPINLFGAGTVASCQLKPPQMPPAWLGAFPSASEIVRKAVELRPLQSESADVRLIRRRECEFEIFKAVEQALEGPRVVAGFSDLNQFLALSQTILQRRKSRSGRSLELQTREIFVEQGLIEGVDFSHGAAVEGGKRPDFIFPSKAAYEDPAYPPGRLRMLAAKTTARDRWRQILNEADRIGTKHLLTLQEGVSETQYAEMRTANVKLVVPAPLLSKYPNSVQPELVTLESFVAELRTLRT